MYAHSKNRHEDRLMKIFPVQFETFGSTPKNSLQTAKKGYSVIIGNDKYLVGMNADAGKENILTPFKTPAKQLSNSQFGLKLNRLV